MASFTRYSLVMEVHKEHWKGWQGETKVRQLMEAPGSGGSAARG